MELKMFRSHDTICFLGDSVTGLGMWEAEVLEHLNGAKIYNCGVPGGDSQGAIDRLYHNCLSHTPTYVVIMFGMNDIRRALYKTKGNEEEKQKNMEIYFNNMRTLVERCIEARTKVILCTPTPYDDVSDKTELNLYCNAPLAKCAEFIRELAKEKEVFCVDFHKYMSEILQSDYDIIEQDRVHPTERGMHIMAQLFMRETGIISQANFDGKFVMTEENKKRYDVEQKLVWYAFAEYCVLSVEKRKNRLSKAQKVDIINSLIPTSEGNIKDIFLSYSDDFDNLQIYQEEYVMRSIKTANSFLGN